MTDIGRLVREANPVLDESTALTDDELTALLLLAESRSTDMDVKELVTPVEPEPPRQRGWLIAAASFAVVLLIVGAVMAFGGGEAEMPPATEDVAPPTTVAAPPTTLAGSAVDETTISPEVQAVLDDFRTAVNSGDEGAVAAVLAESFVYGEPGNDPQPITGVGWANEMAYLALEGSTMTLENCTPAESGATCDETWTGPVLDAAYPWGWVFRDTFTIEDGLIARIDGVPVSWPSDMWEVRQPIVDWVQVFDPTSAAAMDFVAAGAKYEEEAVLWRHYAPIWVEQGRPSPGQGEFAEAMLVVDRLEQAMNSGDSDEFRPILSEGFSFHMTDTADYKGYFDIWVPEVLYSHTEGATFSITDCVPIVGGVRCLETWEGPVLDAVWPFPWQSSLDIAVADGWVTGIIGTDISWPDNETARREVIVAWVEPQDPEAAALMIDAPSATSLSLEAAAAWLEWAPQWVEAGRP